MSNHSRGRERESTEATVSRRFLETGTHDSYTALFSLIKPQLVSFFRTRVSTVAHAEDLAQEVLLTIYCKAGQVRQHALFRPWVFRIARRMLWRHYGKSARELPTVSLAEVEETALALKTQGGSKEFEFREWIRVLDPAEQDVMMLRFVDDLEYHEIAQARQLPLGTVQWRVFNSKKKLAARGVAGRSTRRVRATSRPE